MMASLESVISKIASHLDERDLVREEAIRLVREVARLSKQVVRCVRSMSLEEARAKASEMKSLVESLNAKLANYPELYYSGLVYGALSEYAEAILLLGVVEDGGVKSYEELMIPPVPYLQGLGDVVGELRRLVLDKVKEGGFGDAWRLFKVMEAILEGMSRLDYPEALAPGVRHRVDVARGLVDATLAFLIDVEARWRLEQELRRVRRAGDAPAHGPRGASGEPPSY
ncbi:MAG: haloacid dehalogenase [Candidatus Nezhaarchaeota archaeon]|nr:haloacid dehalogenase [Candidatus Nezhaarchaeota archaeon]